MYEKFADLGEPKRVWAVGAIGGDAERLRLLHDHLVDHIMPGDRLVYLGNYAGPEGGAEVIDELLLFRRLMLTRPGMEASDFVYLRGCPEEAWMRLFRLQFARDPAKELETLFDAGADMYLRSYGTNIEEAQRAVRSGIPTITRWTNQLRTRQRQNPGHEQLGCVMRRAAYTNHFGKKDGILFVPCGFDPSRPLIEQGDAIWFDFLGFGRILEPCHGYHRIVRGTDPNGLGFELRDVTLTLDNMEGAGPISCAGINPNGEVFELLAVDPLPRAAEANYGRSAGIVRSAVAAGAY